METWPL